MWNWVLADKGIQFAEWNFEQLIHIKSVYSEFKPEQKLCDCIGPMLNILLSKLKRWVSLEFAMQNEQDPDWFTQMVNLIFDAVIQCFTSNDLFSFCTFISSKTLHYLLSLQQFFPARDWF